jgi:hypothetical protein
VSSRRGRIRGFSATLDHIVGSLDARIALDCRALTDGTIAVSDEVRFGPG